jgi:hypothetical protein
MVMAFEPTLERMTLAVATVFLVLGALVAWLAANGVKKLAGVLIASFGALAALAALAAPREALAAGAVVLVAEAILGAVLLVRLQEAYGGVETPAIDAADDADEPAEPGP